MTKRKTYSKEFKLEAVRLLESGNQSAAEIVRELDIRQNLLYKWQKELRTKGTDAFRGSVSKPIGIDELADLKRENERLKEENEILGWSMSSKITGQLVHDALRMATTQRENVHGVLVHSDQGGQYTARDYQAKLSRHAMICSMSRKGECHDNAVAESFFHTLKAELVRHRRFTSRTDARQEIFRYIELFYNRKRRHSYLNYQAPIEYERMSNAA